MNRTPMSQSYVNSQAGSSSQSQAPNPQQSSQSVTFASSSSATTSNSSAATNDNQQTTASLNRQQQQQQTVSTSNNQQQQQQQTSATFQQNVPPELTNLLLEFAFSVFVNKPINIVEYAANYFNELNIQRGTAISGHDLANSSTLDNNNNNNNNSSSNNNNNNVVVCNGDNKRSSNDSQRSHATSTFNNTNNDNDNSDDCMINDDDQLPHHQPASYHQPNNNNNNNNNANNNGQPKLSFNRRKSVFAEQYDPAADDEDDENNRVVHSKTDEQRTRLAKAIKSIFIFRSVDPQDMTDILDAMFEVKVSSGDVVIRQGDDGDNFYVVERGKFQILVTLDDGSRQIRGEYEDSGSFGELALMYNQPRAATVIALSDGSLWAMDRNTFRKIVTKRAFKKRKEYEALFEKVTVLQCLNGYERMNLCDALESKRFGDGQQIILQGDQANGMYFIESGRVKIVKQMDDGRTVDVAILGKGDYFGELALINHKPRAASACAVGDDVKLAFLDVRAFERLLGPCIDRMEKNCALYLNELAQREGRENI